MKRPAFPNRITIDLPPTLPKSLAVQSLRKATPSYGPELGAHAVRAFPAPSVKFKKRREQTEQVARDLSFAKAPMGDIWAEPEVPRYVAFPITAEMQEQLQTFLAGHPEADLEIACMTVMQLGLRQVEIDLQEIRRARAEREIKGTDSPTERAEKMLRLAEHLYLKTKRQCGL